MHVYVCVWLYVSVCYEPINDELFPLINVLKYAIADVCGYNIDYDPRKADGTADGAGADAAAGARDEAGSALESCLISTHARKYRCRLWGALLWRRQRQHRRRLRSVFAATSCG